MANYPLQTSRNRFVVPDGHGQGLALADQYHKLLAPRDAGINQIALQDCCMASGVTITGNSDPWLLWMVMA